MKKQLKTMGAVAGCLAAALAGYAAVIVDDEGVGFVGKGDVQRALGWNNAALQLNASLLGFYFVSEEEASWECEWWTGPTQNRRRHSSTKKTVQSINASIAYDARKNSKGQITGFNLNGFGGSLVDTDGDEVGTCPTENGNQLKTMVPGSLETKVIDEGTLVVDYLGTRYSFLEVTQ